MLSKTLDVAIGITFLYLLTSLVASAVVEMVATLKNWRGRMLVSTLEEMFGSSTLVSSEEVRGSPLISTLGMRGRLPSYIPPSSFSAAVIDVLLKKRPAAAVPSDIFEVTDLSPAAADALYSLFSTTIAIRGNNFQAIVFALEKWFIDAMDRTSGNYKRLTRKCLFAVGLAFALLCNINTVAVAQWLWKGDNARQAVVAEAMAYVKGHPDLIRRSDATPAGKASDLSKQPTVDLNAFTQTYAEFDRKLTAADWPIGWSDVSFGFFLTLQFLTLQFIAGTFLSAIMISLGSSFWFDSLQSLIQIRATGPKP